MEKKDNQFRVRLSQEENNLLDLCARVTMLKKSDIIRLGIKNIAEKGKNEKYLEKIKTLKSLYEEWKVLKDVIASIAIQNDPYFSLYNPPTKGLKIAQIQRQLNSIEVQVKELLSTSEDMFDKKSSEIDEHIEAMKEEIFVAYIHILIEKDKRMPQENLKPKIEEFQKLAVKKVFLIDEIKKFLIKKDLKGGRKMSKENNYINLSEDYELNYALKRNGKSETELNRNLLKIEIETYKMENDVSNIRHDEVDKIISNSDGYEVKD